MTISELTAIAEKLHDLIHRTVPKSSTVSKYGGLLYTLNPADKKGQFCGVFVHKSHVQLSFSEGSSLDVCLGVLSGSGKLRRHINFKRSEDIETKELSKLLKQAAKLSTTDK